MSCYLVTASSRFIGRPHRDPCSRASPHTKDLICHSRSNDCRSCPNGGSEQRRRLTTRPGVSMHTQTQRDIITGRISIFKNRSTTRAGHTTCAQGTHEHGRIVMRSSAYELPPRPSSADSGHRAPSSSSPTRRARPRHDNAERSSVHGDRDAASRIPAFTRSANAGRSAGSGSSTRSCVADR